MAADEGAPAPDAIDQAIAAVPDEPPSIKVTTYNLTLSSGLPAAVSMPNDASDRDWLDLIGIIMAQVRPTHISRIQHENPMSALLVPQRPQLLVPGR